jgi:hypothetical protein
MSTRSHVRGYTMLHRRVPEQVRASFAGLPMRMLRANLPSLWIMAAQLSPIRAFVYDDRGTLVPAVRVEYRGRQSRAARTGRSSSTSPSSPSSRAMLDSAGAGTPQRGHALVFCK